MLSFFFFLFFTQKSINTRRSYLRVTSLEEQLVEIESRQVNIGREERLASEAYELALEEARKPKARPIWDKVEGDFRRTRPLLKTLRHRGEEEEEDDDEGHSVDNDTLQRSQRDQTSTFKFDDTTNSKDASKAYSV